MNTSTPTKDKKYVALGKEPEYNLDGIVEIAEASASGRIGTARFIIETWSPHPGIGNLYELFEGDRSVGIFVLLKDGSFLPYTTWVEQAQLPPQPQHAINAARLHSEIREREMVCLVHHAEPGEETSRVHFFQQRPYWEQGRYEGLPSTTLLDALHSLQRVRTQRLLIPFRLP
jgi:hypothetical protein